MGAGGPPHAQLARAARTLCALGPWRRPVDRRRRAARSRASRAAQTALRPLPAGKLFRTSRLVVAWRGLLNDLLPLPYTEETLARIVEHVDQVQTHAGPRDAAGKSVDLCHLRRQHDSGNRIPVRDRAPHRLRSAARRQQRLRQATNHGTDPSAYLAAFPLTRVKEIHLGGHDEQTDDTGAPLLIDAHGSPVADPVWALYESVIARTGPLPTLIEWDNDVPDWPLLAGEARAANAILGRAAEGEGGVMTGRILSLADRFRARAARSGSARARSP